MPVVWPPFLGHELLMTLKTRAGGQVQPKFEGYLSSGQGGIQIFF